MKNFDKEHKIIEVGIFILDQLDKENWGQNYFSNHVNISKQALNDIIRGKRSLSVKNALLNEKGLNLEEGFLLQMQVFNNIVKFKKESF